MTHPTAVSYTAPDPMNFFQGISDPFTQPLDHTMATPCADARALVETLSVDSYTQMGHAGAGRLEKLVELEARLEGALAQPATLTKEGPWTAADREAAYAFAQAFRLSALYPETVGEGGDIIATLPTPTFSCVHPARPEPGQHAATFRRLCARIGLSDADRTAIDAEADEAVRRLERRKRMVALLRAELQPDAARPADSADALRFFTSLFPGHPLQVGEVEVVATESCIYCCILSNDAFAQTASFLARDEVARVQIADYLKRLRQFNFYNFSHFPAFTSFEAREMDPVDLDRFGAAMELERAELVALFNTAVFIEEQDSLEKYLVHDSWGHYWQADLTDLGTLYERMASLHLPLSPGDTVRLDGKLPSFLDLVYLRRDGTLLFDEALARRYATAWLFERFQPLLAPVIAEMAADMIEYRARQECRAAGLKLPSSSLFPQHPAKVDFAWADLSFFVKSLKRVNALYQKDEELKKGFVERARWLFRLKYRRNYAAVASPEALERELKQVLERLLVIFHETQETHLGLKLETHPDADGCPQIDAFFRVFLKLLQTGMTLNRIIHGQLENARPHLAPCFQTLIMFLVKYFERDPLRGFWTLSDALAAYAVPLMEALAASENASSPTVDPR